MAIVAWENIEAPREFVGLGVGSIRMKNLGFFLLLKWWWHFCGEDESLWKKIVKSVHNINHQYLQLTDLVSVRHDPFFEIAKASEEIP